ncbi:MAG: acyl-ACP--UDP-N-acetylglucosamine O-acyltransferase [Beijerinckiaceae bacterium]
MNRIEDSLLNTIHSMSVIHPDAKLGDGVSIGPFCTVGPDVVLGDGVTLISHVAVAGHTTIGARTRVFPFASLGHEPQDLKFKGEKSTLVIGADCTFREGVTINPGTAAGTMTTIVGDQCVFLANAHIAHDCKLGKGVIFSNNVMLAGHCTVGDYVIMGGGAAVHQFVRIGDHAFIGAMSGIGNDVIPYGMALNQQREAHLSGLNIIGLKRRGFSREHIHELRRAYRLLFANEGTLKERVEDVAGEFESHPLIHEILDFIREGGERAICVPPMPAE